MSFATIGQGILGGVMIGLSAAGLLLGNGDILGASGIVSSVALNPREAFTNPSQQWKLWFLASFLSMSAFVLGPRYDVGEAIAGSRPISMVGYGISGFLVGLGTKLSNGCTSGHGVCGLARLSRRSFAAVCTFMATGVATSIFTSPDISWAAGWSSFLRTNDSNTSKFFAVGYTLAGAMLLAAIAAPLVHRKTVETEEKNPNDFRKIPMAIISGALFASGLFVSTMAYPGKVVGFLDMSNMANGTWDGTLVGVLGGAVIVSLLSYQFLEKYTLIGKSCKPLQHPIALTQESEFNVPSNTVIDKSLIGGAALFGIGWGITGFCPGPALFAVGAGFPAIVMSYGPAFLIGSFLATLMKT